MTPLAPYRHAVDARLYRFAVAGLTALALSGCVSNATAVSAGAGRGATGLQEVRVDGQAYLAEIRPGTKGKQLSRAGARPALGQDLRVTRAAPQMRMHEGAVAKKAARAGCAAAGGRLNEAALGDYDRAGAWLFAGGCA